MCIIYLSIHIHTLLIDLYKFRYEAPNTQINDFVLSSQNGDRTIYSFQFLIWGIFLHNMTLCKLNIMLVQPFFAFWQVEHFFLLFCVFYLQPGPIYANFWTYISRNKTITLLKNGSYKFASYVKLRFVLRDKFSIQ